MLMNPIRIALSLVITAALLPGVDPTLLNLVAKDPKTVAGVDVDRASGSPFGQKVLGEFKDEDGDFRKFMEGTGFDPRRDLREVLMVSDGGQNKPENTLILARGFFNPAKISSFLRQEGKTSSFYKGVEIWSESKSGTGHQGSVALLNSSITAFGDSARVMEAIDRLGQATSGMSASLRARVEEWSGKTDAWFISTVPLNEVGVGKSGSNQVMPQGFSVDSIKEAYAGVKFGSDLQISGETLTRSNQDAQALADVLRFFVSMVRMNAKPGMEGLLRVADTLKVEVSGATTKFSLTVPEEEWSKAIDGKQGRSSKVKTRKSPEVI